MPMPHSLCWGSCWNYPDEVKRMLEIGCELGNHSWDHLNMFELSIDDVVSNFGKADQAILDACGQEATVVRAPYGNCNDEIISAVGKPFFMWSIDSRGLGSYGCRSGLQCDHE